MYIHATLQRKTLCHVVTLVCLGLVVALQTARLLLYHVHWHCVVNLAADFCC